MVLGTENTLAVGERGNGSGDRRWILEGGNGIGGGGEEFTEANRESALPQASNDSPIFLVRLPDSESSSSSCSVSLFRHRHPIFTFDRLHCWVVS